LAVDWFLCKRLIAYATGDVKRQNCIQIPFPADHKRNLLSRLLCPPPSSFLSVSPCTAEQRYSERCKCIELFRTFLLSKFCRSSVLSFPIRRLIFFLAVSFYTSGYRKWRSWLLFLFLAFILIFPSNRAGPCCVLFVSLLDGVLTLLVLHAPRFLLEQHRSLQWMTFVQQKPASNT
jgi:hypothetical protein